MLPYGRQFICEEDIQAVSEVLRAELITTGPVASEFERVFAEFVGAKYAVAVCNATAALHLAMRVAGVGLGDRVFTTPNTFLASANCAAFVDAIPDFCDIDPVSYNLCPESLKCNWKSDTKAVVAVHYAGQTADMPAISQVAKENNAVVIEDACHAVGGAFEHDGKIWKVGGHPWADMTTFSFHPVKTMTTGEGGMIVTDNEEYAKKARFLRTHGMVRDPSQFTGLGDSAFEERGVWYYEMHYLGYNYRITDFQCALGLSQLKRLPESLSRRREIVARYNEAFRDIPGVVVPRLRNERDRELTSWHLYTMQINFQELNTTRSRLMSRLEQGGVGSQVLYIPVHLQPWYRNTYGYGVGKCPTAETYYLRSLSLPLYPNLTSPDIDKVIKQVRESLLSTEM